MARIAATSCETGPSSLHVLASNDRRGAEVFGVDLVDGLRARGLTADVLALSQSAHDVHLDVAALGGGLRFRDLAALRRACSDVEVVVGHGSSSLPALALTSPASPPFVYRSIGDPRHWAPTGMRRARSGFFLRRAAAVVVLWPVIADVVHQMHGIPYDRIFCIPNAVDSTRFPLVDHPLRARARRDLGLPDVPVVAAVGALSPEKDLVTAIDAIARLEDAVLVLAGDGPDRRTLEAHAGDMARAGRVHFLGPVEDPALVLAAADLVLLTSRTEGLPGVLIEAGLSGLPVVATNVGGVREVVVHGETGVVVPPGDAVAVAAAIEQVLADPVPFGLAGRARCLSRFDLPPVVDAWAEMLAEVASRS